MVIKNYYNNPFEIRCLHPQHPNMEVWMCKVYVKNLLEKKDWKK